MTTPTNLDIKEDKINQILLCNTHRDIKNYLKGLKLRNNGNYEQIPNYVIDKKGKVHRLNKDDASLHYLSGYRKEGVIVVCLENRGWLRRRSSDGKYVDWLGDIYKSDVFSKKWRNKLYWDKYTDKQIEVTKKVIKEICKKNNIPNEFIGHNVLVDGIENFKGVVSRSNYNEYWTDINPSFNFEIL